jgi:hypothetical protein
MKTPIAFRSSSAPPQHLTLLHQNDKALVPVKATINKHLWLVPTTTLWDLEILAMIARNMACRLPALRVCNTAIRMSGRNEKTHRHFVLVLVVFHDFSTVGDGLLSHAAE